MRDFHRREKLTDELIRMDVCRHLQEQTSGQFRLAFFWLIWSVLVAFCSGILVFGYDIRPVSIEIWYTGVFVFSIGFLLWCIGRIIFLLIERKRAVKKAEALQLSVCREKLLSVSEICLSKAERVVFRRWGRLNAPEWTKILHFPSGQWKVFGYFYRWSKLYRMSATGVGNTAVVGDEFYLVFSEGTLVYAYNTKFFRYISSAGTEQFYRLPKTT
ncbi:MAG: hypothetical protein J6J21_00360 [Clostridia bacterium]|nr:hypothetical protein [Clostridia bacterium]